jgi:hypothetical protein
LGLRGEDKQYWKVGKKNIQVTTYRFLVKLMCAEDDRKPDSKTLVVGPMHVAVPTAQPNTDSTPPSKNAVYTVLINAVRNM